MSDPIFMTQFELAARWSVDIKTLRNWRHKKFGPSYTTVGRQRLYKLTDILTFESVNYVDIRPMAINSDQSGG